MTDTRTNEQIIAGALDAHFPGTHWYSARVAATALAAAGRLVAPEQIAVPRPHIPHGPAGIPAHVSDADYLREGARHLRGGYPVGGSNLTATVARLLDDAAEAIEKGDPS